MDIFTHAVLPLAAYALLRRPAAERLAAGLGAAMPDMDFFLSWMTRVADPFYAFTHRGWSHTLWGAPLLGVLGLVVLTRPWWVRRWPRMAAFRLTRGTALAAVVGGLSHVALDMLTITGVPALWPASDARFTVNLFFYSAIYMAPVGAWVIWRLYRGTLDEGRLRKATALLLAALVVGGGLRAATLPTGLPEGAVVQPTPSEVRWVVALPLGNNAWRVEDRGFGGSPEAHELRGNATSEAAAAIAAAQGLGAYVAWRWVHPTPLANATRLDDGGWRVEFRDAVALHRNLTGGLVAGLAREPRPLVIDVHEGQPRLAGRPGTFGFDP